MNLEKVMQSIADSQSRHELLQLGLADVQKRLRDLQPEIEAAKLTHDMEYAADVERRMDALAAEGAQIAEALEVYERLVQSGLKIADELIERIRGAAAAAPLN